MASANQHHKSGKLPWVYKLLSKIHQEYLQMAKPLYKLILGENALKKQKSVKWDLECQKALDKLKELCTTTPILAYGNFGKPFKLYTDANVLGLGAVLYQVHDVAEQVISYAS